MAIDTPVATPTPDTALEGWIDTHGASFALQRLRFDDIDQKASLSNQARFKALDETVVLNYAAAMERGDQFPPIVVFVSAGRFVVIDGNHRVAAADLIGTKAMDAYVLTNLSHQQIQTMTFEANARHGLPTSNEERIQHGLFLVENGGITIREAAALVNVSVNLLTKEATSARADRRFATLNVDRWTNIARNNRTRMEAIRSDVVFAAAGKLVVEAHLPGEAVSSLVTAINKAGTEADQLAVVTATRERNASTISMTAGGRSKMPTSLSRLSRSLSYSEGVDMKEVDRALSGMNTEDRAAFAGRINQAVLVLIEARRAIDGAAQR
jgi:hypothetical protein